MKKTILSIAVASVIQGAILTVAKAQEQSNNSQSEGPSETISLERIEVSARKKVESIQDVPAALSVLSNLQLEQQGIDDFSLVLNTIPNASQSGGIAGGLQGLISIRGISTLVRFVGLETGVGFYVDGVYAGRPENFNQDLIDIERIEVLRGPQGAVFGKNTIAGAINIITKTPFDSTEAKFEAQLGNYNLRRVRGYVNGGLIDGKLSGSLSAGYVKRDGYVKNSSGIGPDLDDADMSTFRGKLHFQATDDVEFIFSADALYDRSKPVFFETADVSFVDDPTEQTPFTVNQDQPNFLDRDIFGASITANIDFDTGTWTTIAGYRDSSFDAAIDDDKVPVRFFVDFFTSDTTFTSVESRFSGNIGNKADYLVGLYYFTQEAANVSNFALGDFLTGVAGVEPPIDLTSSVDADSIAVFFNTDIVLSDDLTMELGGRYLEEEKQASHIQDDNTGIFGSTDFSRSRTDSNFSANVSLSYQFNSNVTSYARYAEGFKSAGFNTDFVSANSNLEVEPEYATSYEVGLKSDLLDRRMRLNLAVFTTDYEDLQLSQIVDGGVSLNNASAADISGVELDFRLAASANVQIDGSAGYLDATYRDFPGCPVPGAETGEVSDNCAGNFLNIAPKWSAAMGVQYNGEVNNDYDFMARVDWNYRSEVFFEPQNSERLSGSGRGLVNARVGLLADDWEIFFWANNLLDKTYVNFADDRSAIFVNTTVAYGAPRTFGLTYRYKY